MRAADGAERIVDQELPILHAEGTRDKRHQRPGKADESPEEHRLGTLTLEEHLHLLQPPLSDAETRSMAEQPLTSQLQTQVVPDVVADRGTQRRGMLLTERRHPHVLGPHANAHRIGRNSLQPAPPPQKTERERERNLLLAAGEHVPDHSVLHENLDPLGDPGRQLPPLLYGAQMLRGGLAVSQGQRQDVGGGNGVLYGEVDADSADRRHGMCGIAKTKQPGTIPLAQVVHLYGQKLHLTPVNELVDPAPKKRSQCADGIAERRPSVVML